MKIVFFGSSKYSTIVEKTLFKKFGLILVVTIKDRPSGRAQKLTQNPVKEFAIKNKIPVLDFDVLDRGSIDKIAKVDPDFLVVCDFGLILPKELLVTSKYASLNVHHSLLPKYRGPTPAPNAILAGEKISGVTIIEMTDKVDAGPIVAQKKYQLSEYETTDSLLLRLNRLGVKLLIDIIPKYISGKIQPKPQDESLATYTMRFTKEDGHIDLHNPPDSLGLDRMIRAFYQWPGVYIKLKSKNEKLKIIKFLPGNLIQPEGKRPMTIGEFSNGYPEAKETIVKLNLI